MDWLKKAKSKKLKDEASRQATIKYINMVKESGLLEKIERKKREVYQESGLKFGLSPLLETRQTYEEIFYDYDHFNCNSSSWRVEYYQQNFCIVPRENGVYWELYAYNDLKKRKRINPNEISDKEIHKWFGLLLK